mgnify:FL=1
MSDEYAEKVKEELQPVKPDVAGRSVSLTITLHPNGQIEFSMPTNKVMAHGLLGAAQEQLAKLAMMQELQQMSKAANGGGVAGLLKKMGRG